MVSTLPMQQGVVRDMQLANQLTGENTPPPTYTVTVAPASGAPYQQAPSSYYARQFNYYRWIPPAYNFPVREVGTVYLRERPTPYPGNGGQAYPQQPYYVGSGYPATPLSADSSNSLQCEECNLSFMYQSDLERHSIIHDKDKWFQCSHCPHKTPYQCNLAKHFEKKHEGFRCEKCTFKSKSRSLLFKHKQEVHEQTEKHICRACGKQISNARNLKKHEQNVCKIGEV